MTGIWSDIVRRNASADPEYCPYCLKCETFVRMKKIEKLYWKCKCGAEHDEREHSGEVSKDA